MTTVDAATRGPSPVTVTPPATLPDASDDSGFSFHDLLDIVNPLQHIPVVSTLYRHLTGDTPKTFPKIAGDLLYGGVEGFAGSLADTVFEKITGKSFGETVLAKVEGLFSSGSDGAPTGVAANTDATIAVASAVPDAAAPAPDAPPVLVASATPAFILSDSPLDTTATPVASDAPALPAPADVKPASLDTIVVPGQDALIQALGRNGVGADLAMRAADAYRRTIGIANGAAPAPKLRATIAD